MTAPTFWSAGYTILDDLLEPAERGFVKAAMDASHRTGRMHFADRITPGGAMNEYAPIAGEAMLRRCRLAIERCVGRPLLPSYAFWRIYPRGAALARHVDRSACEVSATVAIVAEPAEVDWPIHVRDLDGIERGIALRPGQAMVYQGCRVPHWREPFAGIAQYQLFLHYVVEDGEKAGQAFDRRVRLSV